MRCEIHCPKPGGGDGVLTSLVAFGAACLTVYFLWQALPLLAVLAAVAVVLGAAAVPVTRWLARRVCVPRWSAAYRPPVKRPVPRPAVTTGQRAIEAPKPAVPGVVLDNTVKKGAR